MSSLQYVRATKDDPESVKVAIADTRANLLKIVMNNRETKRKDKAKILVIGLSGAGKSTLMEFLKKGAVIQKQRQPTISFNRYFIDFGKLQMIFIDAPGQKAYWKEWSKYITSADGILFIMDSANFRNVRVINTLVYDLLKLHRTTTPLLFLANKQDLEAAISVDSINNLLGINERCSSSAIYPISALNGEGILDAFKWLLVNILN